MMTKKERELLHTEKELDRYLNPGFPVGRRFQEHDLTHIPYRSWCVHCVRGTGRSGAHRRRARQDEEEREQHMTTSSIDTGDLCTREEMERVGWDKTRDTALVSEDLATGGIRAHLVSAKGNGDPWIARKIKDDIEEFGYGGAPVRIKSDQEPATVDVPEGSDCQARQCTYHTCEQSRWRFSIQRTSGKRNQEGSKNGEHNSFKSGVKMGRQCGS